MDDVIAQAMEVLKPLKKWSQQCHAASMTLVQAGIGDRVARGFCAGVGGQHSWVVIGNDCYDPRAIIIDPTLWSYRKDVRGIYLGTSSTYGHKPHGDGSIWEWGKPVAGSGKPLQLTPKRPLSRVAREFLRLLGPLDHLGWARLSSAPVGEWPAAEIFAAMDDTKELTGLVPVDKLGMLTNRNPGGLYLRSVPPTKKSKARRR